MNSESTDDVPTDPFVHWCESCGREESLDSRDAYKAGWDFPPHMGTWGVVSPRTCPNCPIQTTASWALAVEERSIDKVTPQNRWIGLGRVTIFWTTAGHCWPRCGHLLSPHWPGWGQ